MEWYFQHNEFVKRIDELVHKIKASGKEYTDLFPIPRGGLVVAVYLSHRLCIPVNLDDRPNPESLIVDDIADSGETLSYYSSNILWKRGKKTSWDTCTIHYKPTSKIKPTYYAVETEDWIIYPWQTQQSSQIDMTAHRKRSDE